MGGKKEAFGKEEGVGSKYGREEGGIWKGGGGFGGRRW